MLNLESEADVLKQIEESPKLILQIGAEWCRPCTVLKLTMKELEPAHLGVTFAYLDADLAQDFVISEKVMSIPTVIAYEGRQKIGSVVGSTKKIVVDLLSKFSA